MDFNPILEGLGYAAAYTVVGLVLLAVSMFVLDLLTPGRYGSHLIGPSASGGAGLVGAAWMLGQGLIIFTAIWGSGTSAFGVALLYTVVFGLAGVLMLAVTYVAIDLLTPGRLGDTVCEVGAAKPLSYVLASGVFAMSAIISACITA